MFSCLTFQQSFHLILPELNRFMYMIHSVHCAHLYAVVENASRSPCSPVPCVVAECCYSQKLTWGTWSWCLHTLCEDGSSRGQFTAPTAFWTDPQRCLSNCWLQRARKQSSTSYCRFCCFPFPHPITLCSKDRDIFSLNCQKRRMKEATFTPTKQAAGTEIGKTEAHGYSSAPSLAPAAAVLLTAVLPLPLL